MKIFLVSTYFFIMVGMTFSCAHARVVKSQPGKGGLIAVGKGMFGDARAEADLEMRRNCGSKRPVILEEGEHVVGTSTSTDNKRTKRGSRSTGTTRDRTEWRIKYKCGKA